MNDKERITVWLPQSTIAKLKALAVAKGVSASEVLEVAFDEHLESIPGKLRKALDVIAVESKTI